LAGNLRVGRRPAGRLYKIEKAKKSVIECNVAGEKLKKECN